MWTTRNALPTKTVFLSYLYLPIKRILLDWPWNFHTPGLSHKATLRSSNPQKQRVKSIRAGKWFLVSLKTEFLPQSNASLFLSRPKKQKQDGSLTSLIRAIRRQIGMKIQRSQFGERSPYHDHLVCPKFKGICAISLFVLIVYPCPSL